MTKRPPPSLTEPPDRWLTTAEMCAIIGCTRQTLSRLVAGGDIRASRLGRAYRYAANEPARYFTATAVRRSA